MHLHRLAFVGEGGVAGDDKQAGDLGEIAGEHFGEAVAEVLLVGVFAHVDEGQDDEWRVCRAAASAAGAALGARGWGLGVRGGEGKIADSDDCCRDEQQASHSHHRPFSAGKARPTSFAPGQL